MIPSDGTPFVINSVEKLDCIHGKDRNKSAKENRKAQKFAQVFHFIVYFKYLIPFSEMLYTHKYFYKVCVYIM